MMQCLSMEEDEFLGNKFFVDTVLVISIQWIYSHKQEPLKKAVALFLQTGKGK